MKKYLALLLLLPTVFMTISGAAQAQRKNTTSHDVPPKIEAVVEENKTITPESPKAPLEKAPKLKHKQKHNRHCCCCDKKHHHKNKKHHHYDDEDDEEEDD